MMKLPVQFILSFCLLFCNNYEALCHRLPKNENSPTRLIVPPESTTSSSVTLLWNKPEQYRHVKEYKIFQNGKCISTSHKTNITISGLEPNTIFSFFVKAIDDKGNLTESTKTIKVRTKSKGKIFNVVDYGAKGDGITMDTHAIQRAINACSVGGTVFIPRGIFLSGSLFLKSNMTFSIARGGVLKGSIYPKDYSPLVYNRFEGWELTTFPSLLNAGKLNNKGGYSVRNLTISGLGIIKGGGAILGNAMIAAKGLRGRGRLILLMNAQNVNIQGLTIEDSPCWTIHYIYSNNVTLHDLTINSSAMNSDGIDPDSSTDSYIFNCTFSNGDDCIAIKSGKNPEGYFIGKPAEHIYISNCNFIRGHGISIGSEISGGIRNIFITDCKAGNLLYGMQIKATKDRGGYVKNVIVKDCDLLKITMLTSLPYNNDGKPAPVVPYFANIQFSNINMSSAKPNDTIIVCQGFQEKNHYTKNVSFKKIILPENSTISLDRCKNFLFKSVCTVDNIKAKLFFRKCIDVNY